MQSTLTPPSENITVSAWNFESLQMPQHLQSADLDTATFGIIGFDSDCMVRQYNRTESEAAGLANDRVLGRHLFEVVAPCMNNYLVAQRFEEALVKGEELDALVDYVLTLKMKPTPVRLRLIASAAMPLRYILVERR